ncbi:hypothetical protein Bca52824_057565 [Brassica carinata]|uniref:Uncharacterized protein n=1 Tax=Brassica carinata TaxID=52824 RepID=A0A8X7UCU8_BRACI|nr:hypothetical protein Bca52824_057565 [Brassica carinata]
MVMTISCSNESMFPPYENDFEAIEEQFMSRCGVKPRPHWITTEFGGKVCASEGVQNQIAQDFEEISSVADFCDRYVLQKVFKTKLLKILRRFQV